jgi:hypothetical protein
MVPANTPKSDPVRQTLSLRSGVVARISVLIPPGHCGLAHLAIYEGETQIMPWGDDQWLEGNGEVVTWEPDYILPSEPAALEARGWNEDDMFDHRFFIRVWVEPFKVKPDWGLLEEAAARLTQFVKRVMGEE